MKAQRDEQLKIMNPTNSANQTSAKSVRKPLLQYWLPVLAWMALIFGLSSLPGSTLSDFGSLDFVVKKLAHVTEYAILHFLLFRALRTVIAPDRALFAAAVISLLYAISDEYHQTFVPLREGRIRDVFIDSIGIAAMYLYLRRRYVPR